MTNPELILHNGIIYPDVDRPKKVEALAVWKGRILHLGPDREILKLRARSVEVLDLKGRSVIPGLSDSHLHLLGYGMLLRTLDLNGPAA
jgi:predicted amidohydrolase YtcJ